jgi:hypothetical protein
MERPPAAVWYRCSSEKKVLSSDNRFSKLPFSKRCFVGTSAPCYVLSPAAVAVDPCK